MSDGRFRLKEILASADEDGNGVIEFPEIVALMEKNLKRQTFLEEMRKAFTHFDRDLVSNRSNMNAE